MRINNEDTKIYILWLLAILVIILCIFMPAGVGQETKEPATTITTTSQVTTKPTTSATITTKKVTTAKTTKKKKTTKKTTVKKATKGDKKVYQNYAHDLVINKYGWTEEDFDALVWIWNRESGWNPYAENKKSGAYGIPQAWPAKKMASAGDDWRTNYKTQINWGLKYIKKRYGSPLKAKKHYQTKGYY